MPAIDLSILNQRQTPAFYADTLANRPAAGFVGRIFVSTNTFAFFRDNGTGWDLIGGPGTGTVTGSGAAGQVSFWNGANTITGSNNLFWDNVNGHLGVGTVTPGTALDVKHDQSTVVQLEQETATNDIRIAFINSGVGLWRLGSFYNAGANDFGLFDIAAAAQRVTVKRTTGQVLIGTSTVGTGKLVVASTTGDNGVQIVGASAPSLRIDNAEIGPTARAGFGISTATNNFIQGSADRDFCMFNGSTTASPILFGIYDAAAVNVQEAARISPARNFLIGTTTDAGQKLQVNGTALITGATTFNSSLTANNFIASSGNNTTILNSSNATTGWVQVAMNNTTGSALIGIESSVSGTLSTGSTAYATIIRNYTNTDLQLATNNTVRQTITSAGNVGIGTTTPNVPLVVTGTTVVNSIMTNQVATFFKTNGISIGDDGTDALIGAENSGTNLSLLSRSAGVYTKALNVAPTSNILIGTTTDAGQKLQVNGTATATKFNTTEDVFTNIAAGATSTIFTMADSQMYLVYITQGAAGSCVTFTSSVAEGGVTAIIGIISTSDTNILITASGLNVRATNNFGATVTMKTTIIRIK
jgi:hypothetical protein